MLHLMALDAVSTSGALAGSKHPALLCILRGGLSGMSSHVPVQEEVGSTSVLSICQC